MSKKLRTVFLALRLLPYFIYCYFFWIIRYSRNPKKYPFTKRYMRVRRLSKRIIKAYNLDVKVYGLENIKEAKTPFLGVSNHRNFLDPIFLICLFENPISFVAKKESEKLPFVGRILHIIDGYFIDRQDILSQARLFKELSDSLKTGEVSYFIYPEGTRLRDLTCTSTLPYKHGSIKPAYWANTDIVYVAHYGADFTLLPKKKGMKKRPVYFTIFKPLKHQDFKDVQTIDLMPFIERNSRDAVLKMANEYQNHH